MKLTDNQYFKEFDESKESIFLLLFMVVQSPAGPFSPMCRGNPSYIRHARNVEFKM